MKFVEQLTQGRKKVTVLHEGSVLAEGLLSEVQADDKVVEVLSKLDHQITSAYITVSDLARSKGLAMRDAALAIAIDRVASMCRERGWI